MPAAVEGEHEDNPPHFQLTQQRNPDFSPWRESGKGLHGFRSHLHDPKELAKDIAIYYAMVSLMDKQIGQIVDRLDELRLSEGTLVVFTSDHGHFYGQHGLIAKGAFHYEDMIKVPMIVRQPVRVPAGKRSEALQSLVDYAPSFLSASGIPIPRAMTGVDQSGVWFGEKESVRDHTLVENRHEPTTIHAKTYVDGRYKITVYYNRDHGELFDLREDPGEIRNLWNRPECAGLKAELVTKLLFAEMGKEPLWMPRVSGA